MLTRDSGVPVSERRRCRVRIGTRPCSPEASQSASITFSRARLIFRPASFNICLTGEWVIVTLLSWTSG